MNEVLKNPTSNLVLKVHWPTDKDLSSAGQRAVIEIQLADGRVLTSLSVPSQQLLEAVAQMLVQYPLVSPDGMLSIATDEITASLPDNRAIQLDQLVANAISTDMLEDEPDAPELLKIFRARLLNSLELVDQAIASLIRD